MSDVEQAYRDAALAHRAAQAKADEAEATYVAAKEASVVARRVATEALTALVVARKAYEDSIT